MNTKDFLRLGVPFGEATRRATDFVSKFILGGGDKTKLHEEVSAIVADPSAFTEDPLRGAFAKALLKDPNYSNPREQSTNREQADKPLLSPTLSPIGDGREGEESNVAAHLISGAKAPEAWR